MTTKKVETFASLGAKIARNQMQGEALRYALGDLIRPIQDNPESMEKARAEFSAAYYQVKPSAGPRATDNVWSRGRKAASYADTATAKEAERLERAAREERKRAKEGAAEEGAAEDGAAEEGAENEKPQPQTGAARRNISAQDALDVLSALAAKTGKGRKQLEEFAKLLKLDI
jgi:colicin import membrane protein